MKQPAAIKNSEKSKVFTAVLLKNEVGCCLPHDTVSYSETNDSTQNNL
jgi:hypothetical protein